MNKGEMNSASIPSKSQDDSMSSSSMDPDEVDSTNDRLYKLRNHQISFADAIDPNAERVHDLREIDVVLGRGRGYQNHPGNVLMRDKIEDFKTTYHSLNREGKRRLVEKVYDEILESGGRFLKQLDGQDVWVVVDRPIALQKVCHTMRCRKSIMKKMDEGGNRSSSTSGHSSHRRAQNPPLQQANSTGFPNPSAVPVATSRNHRAPMEGASMGHLTSVAGIPSLVTNVSMMELEAHRMAAMHRYRYLSGLVQGIDYHSLRREQLIRETMMLQQMGDSIISGRVMDVMSSQNANLSPASLQRGDPSELPISNRRDLVASHTENEDEVEKRYAEDTDDRIMIL